jgi:hypothetical protein
MPARTLKIVLAVAGLALLGLGLLRSGADILASFHSSGSSTSAVATSFMIPVRWLAVALAGTLLCVVAFLVGGRKA